VEAALVPERRPTRLLWGTLLAALGTLALAALGAPAPPAGAQTPVATATTIATATPTAAVTPTPAATVTSTAGPTVTPVPTLAPTGVVPGVGNCFQPLAIGTQCTSGGRQPGGEQLLATKTGSAAIGLVTLDLTVNARDVLPQVGGPATLFIPTTANSAGEPIACAPVDPGGATTCQGGTTGDPTLGGVAVVCFLGNDGIQECDAFGPFQAAAVGPAPVEPVAPPAAVAPPAPGQPAPPPPAGPAPSPPPLPDLPAGRFFPESGFGIHNDAFWGYFHARGGVPTFGFPISREFTFLGLPTQFFQRHIMQQGADGGVQTMNLLDPELMPYTRINASVFPDVDETLKGQTPSVGSLDYAQAVVAFIQQNAPEEWNGLPVRYWTTFRTTVPGSENDPNLGPLMNLEIWGTPLSAPAYDPGNLGFVYQRYQRSIMHFDSSCSCTQALLLADWFKTILTGQGLPPDLADQARGSRYFQQYNNAADSGLNRPNELPGTNMRFAFERDRP
jgi:hypothetical protein